MENIVFQKYTGSGNDFIIIDNRDFKNMIKNRAEFAKEICSRKLSVGADGIIFIENSTVAEFKMVLFQPDGSEAEMCGNGSRCLAKYAFINGIADKEMVFETLAGLIKAKINKHTVSVQLTEPVDFRLNKKIDIENIEYKYDFVNTGVPHTIIFVKNINDAPVLKHGNLIRFHEEFKPSGTNVNFVEVKKNENKIFVRTYERGVENETLACGTGSTASALMAALNYDLVSPITVVTKSKKQLKIHFDKENLIKNSKTKNTEKINLFLEGEAILVYEAELKYSEILDLK